VTTRRTALVVGAGAPAGLGAALCRRFAREGLHVVAVGRTLAKLEALAQEVARAGGAASPCVADATRAADVARAFDAAAAAGGAPELVVFNAGNAFMGRFAEIDAEFFETAWRTCCLAGFLVGSEAARRMLPPAGRGGTLLFTGATASLRARPPFTAFAAAKAALRALAQGMARELGPQGLHVAHVVIDGGIEGEQLLSRAPGLREARGPDGLLHPDAIAEAYWQLHAQPRSAWSFELDLRPWTESF
jgi:NAD(P)-dependent dehydrogenase (short-subunit alcohol dehydrogenase family)